MNNSSWTGIEVVTTVPLSGIWVQKVVIPRLDEYSIIVGIGAMDKWLDEIETVNSDTAVWIVTDETVWDIHGVHLMAAPRAGSIVKDILILPPGETSKSLSRWVSVLNWMTIRQVKRRDIVVAFGGSVVSDLVGFAAATYMRGIPYLNIPTTLLAQVDGAMGGKVAINMPSAKNIVGAFHQPASVITDPKVLLTLPREERASGLGEVIKTFMIESDEALCYLENNVEMCLDGDIEVLTQVVRLCASIKMHLLAGDPYEMDLRRVLNFGHSVGHPIETARHYRDIRHGEAIALGMCTAARIGRSRGLTSPAVCERLERIVERAELPTRIDPANVSGIVERVDIVKAIRGGALRFVIPAEVGQCLIIDDVTHPEIEEALIG